MATEVLEQTGAADRLIRRAATLKEFRSLPESLNKTEYINGEIIVAPSPTPSHQSASGSVFSALRAFVLEHKLGVCFYSPLDVVLPTGEVVQPDILFLTAEEAKRFVTNKRIEGVPSLVVEILSTGSITHDTLTKRRLYEQNGVREYWIVDVEDRTIAQLVLRKKHYVLTELAEGDSIKSAALAGFEMNVGRLLGL